MCRQLDGATQAEGKRLRKLIFIMVMQAAEWRMAYCGLRAADLRELFFLMAVQAAGRRMA